MVLNVDKKENLFQGRQYPCLMKRKNNGCILLVESEINDRLVGTVIYGGNSSFSVGHHDISWDKNFFEEFFGKITLTN